METSMGSKTCKNGSINTEVPTLTLGSVTSTKDTITIPYTTNANDITCRYGTSASDLSSEGTINNNTCTISELDETTRYYYQLSATNELNRTTTVSGDIETKANLYTEEILAGNDPVIKEDLVPVTIGTNGAVKKADTSSEWYKYANKEWANAVILTGTDSYNPGDTIPESAIQSYFVWIPKYDYKIQTLGISAIGQEKAFEIRFSNQNTSDSISGECTTPSTSTASGSNSKCAVGDYMTHPAFIHFKDGIKGLWVGKFETTGTTSAITVKPNVTSLRNQAVSAMHNAAIGYKSALNSHMMKNTEWGAVAYLTNSNYGRCTNGTCTEVYINNNSNYITGWSGTSASASSSTSSGYAYTNANSVNASTTGNYTGIYDMSGGAWEYVMGNNNNVTSSSGFSSMPATKYYDKYANGTTYNDNAAYSRRILGDATAETKQWFSNGATFVRSSSPWFARGGGHNGYDSSGLFCFVDYEGFAFVVGFRLVLVE